MKLLGVIHTDPFGETALLGAIRKLQVDWVSFELVESHEPDEIRELPEKILSIVANGADDVNIELFKRIVYMYNFEARVRDHLKKSGVTVYNSDSSVPILLSVISKILIIGSKLKRTPVEILTEKSRILMDNLYDLELSNRSAYFIAIIFETSTSGYGDLVDRDCAIDQLQRTPSPLDVRYRDYRTAKKLRTLARSSPDGLHVCGLAHIYGKHNNLLKRLSDLKPSVHFLSEFH